MRRSVTAIEHATDGYPVARPVPEGEVGLGCPAADPRLHAAGLVIERACDHSPGPLCVRVRRSRRDRFATQSRLQLFIAAANVLRERVPATPLIAGKVDIPPAGRCRLLSRLTSARC